MSTITTEDGTQIYYKDWGEGRPVVLSHGWPLSADAWGSQMLFLASKGFRCIAHDRRGHGRSSQPATGNEMIHGDDDQIVPIEGSARQTAKLVEDVTLKVYEGGPHGLFETHKDQLSDDLLEFLS